MTLDEEYKLYQTPQILEFMDESPLMIQIIDKDKEILQMEYHDDGLVIFKAFGGVESPLIPAEIVTRELSKLLARGLEN